MVSGAAETAPAKRGDSPPVRDVRTADHAGDSPLRQATQVIARQVHGFVSQRIGPPGDAVQLPRAHRTRQPFRGDPPAGSVGDREGCTSGERLDRGSEFSHAA